jgi:hypothetical protein
MSSNTQTGIELYSRIDRPLDAIAQIGTFFAKSGMFGCEKVEQGMVLAMECLATNKQPSVIARTYHIMDGKLSKKALAALAEFRSAGGKHKWIRTGEEAADKEDDRAAELELTFDGNTIRYVFSVKDAKRMGVSFKPGSGWSKAVGNMLRARAISNGVAMLAPEIFAGDVEDESSSAPVAPLLPETPVESAPKVVTAPAQEPAETRKEPPKTIEVEVVKTAPSESTPLPAAGSSAATAQADASGNLSTETQKAIIAHVGEENCDALQRWLVKQTWLTDGQNLSALRADRAQKLLNANRESVLQKIGVKKIGETK